LVSGSSQVLEDYEILFRCLLSIFDDSSGIESGNRARDSTRPRRIDPINRSCFEKGQGKMVTTLPSGYKGKMECQRHK
jgi:hypothetical protein